MIKLSIYGFWPNFNYEDNFFKSLFEDIYGEDFSYTTNPYESNLCLIGENLVPPNLDRTKTKLISHIAEPKDPFYDVAEYHFTFDPTDLNRGNIRIPLWMIYINRYNLLSEQSPILPVNLTNLQNNEWYNSPKTNFCITPFSAVHKNRIEFWETFNTYKKTDGFGLPFGNGDHERNQLKKYYVISPYKFCMAYENTNKLGYVTEKLLQAKTSGCIPIYWGSDYVLKDFNPNGFIYVNNFNSIKDVLEYVKIVDNDQSLYQTIHNSPIFHYDINEKYEEIKNKIKQTISL
jgi:hypothetical protein